MLCFLSTHLFRVSAQPRVKVVDVKKDPVVQWWRREEVFVCEETIRRETRSEAAPGFCDSVILWFCDSVIPSRRTENHSISSSFRLLNVCEREGEGEREGGGVRERECVCVWVCVREGGWGRERERERVCVCVREGGGGVKEGEWVCVCEREFRCVCVRERGNMCVCVCVRESEREREWGSVCMWKKECLCDFTVVTKCYLFPSFNCCL